MIRVSKKAAAAIGAIAGLENISIADWLDRYAIPLAEKLYRKALVK